MSSLCKDDCVFIHCAAFVVMLAHIRILISSLFNLFIVNFPLLYFTFTEKFYLYHNKLTGFIPPKPSDFSSLGKFSLSVG